MGRLLSSGILPFLSRQKFLERFDANSYLHLLRALDMYDPSLGYENIKEALSRIKARYTLVSVTTDQLFKPVDLYKSKQLLEQSGVDLHFMNFHQTTDTMRFSGL